MSRSIKIDLASAFAASGAKAFAYAAISSMLLASGSHTADFAIFTLIRSTLGLLNYATLGLAPAFIRQLAITVSGGSNDRASLVRLYASAQYPALAIGVVAVVMLCAYSLLFTSIHVVPESLLKYAPLCALLVGLAMLFRLISDIPGGYLQAIHRITLDNTLLLSADLIWPVLTWFLIGHTPTPLVAGSLAFCICYFALALLRFVAAGLAGAPVFAGLAQIERGTAVHLLGFGAVLTLSQLSDFLYAPTDFLLVNWFTPASRLAEDLADYSLAVQLDAGLLLLTSAVASVLYQRASHAIGRRDAAALHRYYVRGTVLTVALLLVAATVLVLVAKPLLMLWLQVDRPGTRRILPLLMLHSVIGGSSAPARAILLAAGKARVFAGSAVIAGLLNLVISYTLIRYTDLGLVGVILGTIIAVTLRCAFFLPWYTRQVLKEMPAPPRPEDEPPATATIEQTV